MCNISLWKPRKRQQKSGTTHVPIGKKAISPDKFGMISNMLDERLSAEGIPNDLAFARSNRVDRLLNNAISNANRTIAKNVQQPINQPMNQPINQSINQPIIQPTEQPLYQPINQTAQQQFVFITNLT